MKIGFTGSRKGMTKPQALTVEILLCGFPVLNEVHHGCCVGSDAQFHHIAERQQMRTISWPALPIGNKYRADLNCSLLMPIEPIWSRNRKIASLDVLIAAPAEFEEQKNGGTWGTLRIAREPKLDRPRVIVYPDGSLKWERDLTGWQPWQDCTKFGPPDHAVELLFNDGSVMRDEAVWDDFEAVYYAANIPDLFVTHWREFDKPNEHLQDC